MLVDLIEIAYTIRTDQPYSESPFFVDVAVELDDAIRSQMLKFIMNTSSQKVSKLIKTNINLTLGIHSLEYTNINNCTKDPFAQVEERLYEVILKRSISIS